MSTSRAWEADVLEQFLDRPGPDMSFALLDAEDGELQGLMTELRNSPIKENASPEDLRNYRLKLLRAGARLKAQSQIRAELRSMALTDDLTGFYNRRGFLILGMQLLKYARRNSQPALVFFADIDNLKTTNDRYGHAAGDALLVRCARVLKESFRDSDIVARLGGDEFAVLALEANDQNDEGILIRLDKALARANEENDAGGELSLSLGMARFDPQNAVSLGELLNHADGNMYEQKSRRFAGGGGTEVGACNG